MNWFTEVLHTHSFIQAVAVISMVAAIGLYLGRLKFFGVSLGVTCVFFAGIVAGHFGIALNKEMLGFAQNFGLILFVYTLGLQVGPGFFSSLMKGGIKLNMLSLSVILVGTSLAIGLHYTTGISIETMVGLLSGAVTNTPALGAAQQTLLQISPESIDSVSDMALACAIAYPLGVLGVMLAIVLMRKLFANNTEEAGADVKTKDTHTHVAEFHVSNPAIYDKNVGDLKKITNKHFVISRMWRDNKLSIPASDTLLKEGDRLLIISIKSDVEAIRTLFGEQENVDWNKEDIDWNAIDPKLISKRVIVTRERVNGVKLGSLRLRNLYGINITRIDRAGIDLLASPNLVLQIGDRLTVVGETNAVKSVIKILGDQEKRLDNPNLLSIFIGIMIGVILGAMPITFPGMSEPVKLGVAGGPIVVGILIGAFGPRLHLTTYTTQSANLMMRHLGIVIYLACLGLASGSQFFETLLKAEGAMWIGIGFFLTIAPVMLVSFIAYKFFKVGYANNVGMICGCMANPMALTYANTTVEGDEPSVSYATVYPLSMFVRVIIAQAIILIFV